MDASLVLTKPAPPPKAAANAPTSEPEHAEDDFAAHLPPEETPPPTVRRPVARDARADEDTATPRDANSDKTPEDVATLAAPNAPVLIRPQNSVVIFDLSAVITQGVGDVATVGVTTPSPATVATAAQTKGTPGAPASAAGQAAVTEEAPEGAAETAKVASTNGAASEPAEAISLRIAQKLPDALVLPSAVTAPADARVPTRLRTGRAETTGETATETKAAAYTGIAANSGIKAASKVETAFAVQAASTLAPSRETTPSIDTAPVTDAIPAEQRASRLNEAVGAAGHRATTPTALVAQHIVRRFEGRSTSIDVRLDPVELGRVQVSLEVAADNKVTAVVAAENPATLAELVRSARELERALQDAGLELGSGGLSFDLAERRDDTTSEDHASGGRGSGRDAAASDISAPLPSRPFGLESWRGARIDVMV